MNAKEKMILRNAVVQLGGAKNETNKTKRDAAIDRVIHNLKTLTGDAEPITTGGTIPVKEPIPVPKDPILAEK